MVSWSSRLKKEGIFCIAYFVRKKFFNICVLSQCILYWIHFQNMHTFTYQKILLNSFFCLFLKSSYLQFILKCFPVFSKNCNRILETTEINGNIPANIYLFKVNNRNTKKRCEFYSKLTIKTPERRQWCRSAVYIVNFEHIPHLFLVFLFLILNKYMLAGIDLRPKLKFFQHFENIRVFLFFFFYC